MKTEKIIYTHGGKLHIVNPSPDMFDANSATRKLLESKGVTFANDDAVLAWIEAKSVPGGATKVRKVAENKIPKDRTNRDAWKDDDIK